VTPVEVRVASARITNADIASASMMAFSGTKLTSLREQDRLIDVIMRVRPTERRDASRIRNLYVLFVETLHLVDWKKEAHDQA